MKCTDLCQCENCANRTVMHTDEEFQQGGSDDEASDDSMNFDSVE